MTISSAFWNICGGAALGLGAVGIILPLLPTVPFFILAAFCFARGNPVWEAKLLAHPRFGPPILAWRERGIVSRRGKLAASIAFAFSIVLGLWIIAWPWWLVPPAVAAVCLSWLWTRPES